MTLFLAILANLTCWPHRHDGADLSDPFAPEE